MLINKCTQFSFNSQHYFKNIKFLHVSDFTSTTSISSEDLKMLIGMLKYVVSCIGTNALTTHTSIRVEHILDLYMSSLMW